MTRRSKKQDRVSHSSGMFKGLWMEIILNDLKIKVDIPIQLYCDNKSTMSIVHNPVQPNILKLTGTSSNIILTEA